MKRRTFLLAALLAACNATPTSLTADDHDRSRPNDNPWYRKPAPASTPDDVHAVAGASNRFATDMYAQLRGESGNLAFSPASIALALNMTRAGARGETAEQMQKTLHVELDDARAHAAFGNLLHGWNRGGDRPYALAVANRLFGDASMTFKKPFLGITADAYGAELEPLSFSTRPDSARETINAWVEDQTEERIRDLLPEGSVTTATALVLTNAVYFKGKWAVAFDPDDTKPATFHAPSGDSEVPMMNVTSSFRYSAGNGVQLVEMPYQGDDLAMAIIVPEDASKLELSHEQIDGWLSQAVEQEVAVSLPRFKIDPPSSVKLKPMLIAMGMSDAFDPTLADLSGIADVPPGERLVIDEAYHKAFVEVNEEGTEAAAATAVVITKEAAIVSEPMRVVADRPFVFLIRDVKSGAILFMGRVEKP